jgi:hypothetical protein
MMKNRLFFLSGCLLIALVAVACASAAVTESAAPVESVPAAEAIAPTNEAPTSIAVTQEVPVVQPVATSRGADLHATDPTTVSLASGQLQFIEFFRYT